MTDTSPANVEALHEQRDWLFVTLSSIGDAVITTDGEGRVTFLNCERRLNMPAPGRFKKPAPEVVRVC